MTKRETALTLMRVAGYHNDNAERVRLIVESRVNRATMDEAWSAGQRAKQNGVPCPCWYCKNGKQK